MHYYYCLSLCFLELWIHLIIGSDLKTMFALGHCFNVRSIGEQASEQQTLFLFYVGLLSVIARSDLCVLLLVLQPRHHSQSHHSEFVCWFLQQATPSMGLVWNLFYKLKLKWVRERIMEGKGWWHWSAGVGFMCYISPISGTKPSINLNVLLQNTEFAPPDARVS